MLLVTGQLVLDGRELRFSSMGGRWTVSGGDKSEALAPRTDSILISIRPSWPPGPCGNNRCSFVSQTRFGSGQAVIVGGLD